MNTMIKRVLNMSRPMCSMFVPVSISRLHSPLPTPSIPLRSVHNSLPNAKSHMIKKKHGSVDLIESTIISDEADEDDDELGDEDEPKLKDYEDREVRLGTRRLDAIVQLIFKQSKSNTEKLILGKKVRINETVVTKKHTDVEAGDTIEAWMSDVEGNGEVVKVQRAIVKKWWIDARGYSFQLRIWREYFVQNWLSKLPPR